MAGLNHSFLVLPELGDRRAQVMRHVSDPAAVCLHDSLVEYLWDTLAWIPSENPVSSAEWSRFGLVRWGPTALSGEGAAIAAQVFSKWADLFSLAPASFELTGPWVEQERKRPDRLKLPVKRDELVATLRAIAQLAERGSRSGHWLLHCGV